MNLEGNLGQIGKHYWQNGCVPHNNMTNLVSIIGKTAAYPTITWQIDKYNKKTKVLDFQWVKSTCRSLVLYLSLSTYMYW